MKQGQIKGLRLLGRIVLFFLLYFSWPLLRQLGKPLVFAVYGTKKHQRAYWPDWIHKRLRGAFPIGLLRFENSWGFVAASNINAEEFAADPLLAVHYIQELRKEFPKAKVIALAGGLPGWLRKAGKNIANPFVDGSLGTRFAMMKAAKDTAGILGKKTQDVIIGLLGGTGYTGSQVVDDAAKDFCDVVAVDPKYDGHAWRAGNVLFTNNPADLTVTHAVIVLTRKGDDAATAVPFFRQGTIVVDDTHPCMSPQLRDKLQNSGVDLWKAVMANGRLQMIPRMPNFRSDSIPGCLLEALVVLKRGRDPLMDSELFFQTATELGFHSELMRHPND